MIRAITFAEPKSGGPVQDDFLLVTHPGVLAPTPIASDRKEISKCDLTGEGRIIVQP